MNETTRVAVDLAKRIFQVTAVDVDGNVVERRKLPPSGAAVVPGAVAEAASWPWSPAAAHTTGGGWRRATATGCG